MTERDIELPEKPHPATNMLVGDDWEDVFTTDQLNAYARAAVLADRLLASEASAGWVMVPREPTEAMWSAGREPVLHRDMGHWPVLFPSEVGECPAWQINPETGKAELDTSKGTTAVHVWRAMLAASPTLGSEGETR